MGKYIIRRLLQGIPTILGVTIITYAIMAAAPGGPTAALNFSPESTPKQQEEMRARLGIDDPIYLQYFRWLVGGKGQKGIIRGDLGRSFSLKKPVYEIIVERIPMTLELTGLALLIGFVVGIPIGVLSAVWQGGIFDNAARVLAVVSNAVPVFWMGLMLILFFGSYLGWLPMGNRCPISFTGECSLADRAEHIAMPVFVLAVGWVAVFSRYMRASMLDVLNSDYVRTARAKGLTNRRVWFGHAARNALIPIATFLGPAIPNLLGGAVITETVFAWPGLGRIYIKAVTEQDFPIVMGITLIGGVGTILGYLLSDILYAAIDPRIRLK